tara:strand:- start:5839 stop:6306 length:468 start_codon:yes stop_codon:yes gene_type:complete
MNDQAKEEKYVLLEAELRTLISREDALVSSMSNFTAAVQSHFSFLWVGFYLVEGNELILGPFQGTVACTKIAFNSGVCGKAWSLKKTLIVHDVHQFPGHIACSSDSNSEIVIPLIDKMGEVIAVLDIDSISYNSFDSTDQLWLEKIIKWFVSEVY